MSIWPCYAALIRTKIELPFIFFWSSPVRVGEGKVEEALPIQIHASEFYTILTPVLPLSNAFKTNFLLFDGIRNKNNKSNNSYKMYNKLMW